MTAPDEKVAEELERLRVRDAARRAFAAETRPASQPPEILTLRDRLALPRPDVDWRIEGWQPAGSRVMLAAQYKAGKTTLVGNLERSLLDGDDWLGSETVHPVDRAVLLDTEMSDRQLDAWLEDQGIRNDDRLVVVPLRGRAATFDILDDRTRSEWARRLEGADYCTLDCLRPVLDALGLDEHREAGRFLTAFDALLTEAGIPDAAVVHHMGHSGERSRGDSRLRDWPDVEWRLVRESDDPASPRYLTAYGRDVDVSESQLEYDPDTRHLTIAGGSRTEARTQAALADVIALLDSAPEPLSQRKIIDGTEGGHTREAILAALSLGIRERRITARPGARRSTLHTLTDPSSAPVRRTDPPVRQRSSDECASAPIGGALTQSLLDPPSAPPEPTEPPPEPEDIIR